VELCCVYCTDTLTIIPSGADCLARRSTPEFEILALLQVHQWHFDSITYDDLIGRHRLLSKIIILLWTASRPDMVCFQTKRTFNNAVTIITIIDVPKRISAVRGYRYPRIIVNHCNNNMIFSTCSRYRCYSFR